jgi:hypothetical protein
MKDKETQEHELPSVDNNIDYTVPSSTPDPVAPGFQQQQDLSQIQQQSTVQTPADLTGLQAEDVDLIERAWVEKAKAIVRSTHGDPFTQNKELSKVKADYIKKRYSKDVKVAE